MATMLSQEQDRNRPHREREQGAKAICRSCPVIRDCLAHSFAAREPYGVWGGLSETERQAVLDHPERRGWANREPGPGPRSGGGPRRG